AAGGGRTSTPPRPPSAWRRTGPRRARSEPSPDCRRAARGRARRRWPPVTVPGWGGESADERTTGGGRPGPAAAAAPPLRTRRRTDARSREPASRLYYRQLVTFRFLPVSGRAVRRTRREGLLREVGNDRRRGFLECQTRRSAPGTPLRTRRTDV